MTVTNDRGTTMADSRYQTRLTLRGNGFQSVKGGFGGVYVAFGWVRDPGAGAWRPSRGGVTGHDYRYIPDSESSDNAGYLRFVAFPGSSTAGEAHAVMSAAGGFSVSLAVPGPVFESTDRDGNVVSVDCRTVTCGVITFGAHGVKNPANETFTPVRFGEVYTDAPEPSEPAATTQGTPRAPQRSADPVPATSGGGTAAAVRLAPVGKPRLRTDRATAAAGCALAFTARGFIPGEQVVAVLDDGLVALGPLQAGVAGEVAGSVVLPADTRGGTHELRLTGAASGVAPTERFAVRAVDPVVDESAETGPGWPAVAFVSASATLFAASLVLLVARLRRRTRHVAVAGSR